MKTLLLMRHAKSSWKQPGLADRDRPLNKCGRRDAPKMGNLLGEEDLVPQCILSSTALRARETAEAVAEAAGYDGEIVCLEELYGATHLGYLQALRSVPDGVDVVLLIGHNPDLQDVLELMADQVERMPTAAIAYLRLPIEHWTDLREDTMAEWVQVWRPRELA
jgi:phosphohistidine phosphatase